MHCSARRVLVVGALLLAFAALAVDAPINALWNDDDGFYYETLDWVRALLLLNATSLDVCMRATPPNVAFCTDGQIDVRYEAVKNEYVGLYRLLLSDGTIWSGRFRAQHCKSK